MNSKALNGSQRVVVDGLLSAEECRELQRLTNVSARTGGADRDGQRMLSGPILQLKHQTSNTNRVLQAAASAGDGYRGKTSPHTPSETFYGVTVLKALKVGVAVWRNRLWGQRRVVSGQVVARAQLGLSPCPVCPPQLGQEGKVPLHSAYLYYNVTDKVRHMMESYFRLEVPLHFSYSHLVCRTAIDGEHGPEEQVLSCLDLL